MRITGNCKYVPMTAPQMYNLVGFSCRSVLFGGSFTWRSHISQCRGTRHYFISARIFHWKRSELPCGRNVCFAHDKGQTSLHFAAPPQNITLIAECKILCGFLLFVMKSSKECGIVLWVAAITRCLQMRKAKKALAIGRVSSYVPMCVGCRMFNNIHTIHRRERS